LAKEVKLLQESKASGEKDLAEKADRERKLGTAQTDRKNNHRQLVIDLLDVWIPATGAELLIVNEGTLGILGLISSIIGVKTQWEAVNGKK